ncbi:MAG: TRAP transporter substrate-binding protein DctP [Thermoleophilia bacterium]|nr:TRAP transporter substrate-binding protein DctP [Thermoleophilia bacterium]
MKKALIVGLVLVAALAIAIVACSRAGDTGTTIVTTAPTDPATASTMPSVTTMTAVVETTSDAVTQEPMTLKYASRFNEGDAGGKVIRRFIDYVEEATDGVVTFEVFFGGNLGSDLEELGLVGSGSVDMTSPALPAFADQLPLANFPMWAQPDAQAAIDYAHHLVLDAPKTSLLIQGEAGASNILYLGFTCGGGNVFVSRTAFAGLGDLAGKKFGASGFVPAFEALGCSIVKTTSSRMHDALAKGAFEATRASFKGSIDLKLHEVAKHFVWDGAYAAANPFVVNLDTWARLTPETRAVFYEAAREAAAFSVELDSAYVAEQLQVLAGAGVSVGSFGPEDRTTWYQLLFDSSAQGCMSRAENLGIVDDMAQVLTEVAWSTGVTWPPPAETTTTVADGTSTTAAR